MSHLLKQINNQLNQTFFMEKNHMITTDLTRVKELSEKIISTCLKGFVKKYNTTVPDVTIQSYNSVMRHAGGIVGWSNEEKFIINPDKVVKNLTICIALYDKSISNLRQQGYSDDVLKTFSPVLIVSSLLIHQEKELILSLSHSHIFATIALLELSNFIIQCENLIGEYNEGASEKELLNLVSAQSRLSIAQEAINKAMEVMYKANDVVRDKISTTDEVALQLQIETSQQKNRQAASMANATPKNTIKYFFECVNSVLALDTEKQLYPKDVVKLARNQLLDKVGNYKIEWKNEAFGEKWFTKKLKEDFLNLPEYLSSNVGKKRDSREATIKKVESELGI
jgi:hypothetical protein